MSNLYFLNAGTTQINVGSTQPVYDPSIGGWVTAIGNFLTKTITDYTVSVETDINISGGGGSTSTPPPIVTGGDLWLLFTVDERVGINTIRTGTNSTSKHIDEFFKGILVPTNTGINLGLASVKADVLLTINELVAINVVTQNNSAARVNQILANTKQ